MQIVGYETPGGALFVSDGPGAAVDRVPLDPGDRLDWALADRHCAGTVHEGDHVACDAEGAPYCRDHRSTWVCARCTGTCLKDEMDCFDDHAVYLAAFAPDTFKVGVTREWRLDTRLREQGADRAAHLRTVENGRVAREREAGIAEEIPDRVRVPTKIAGLGATLDAEAWDDLLAGFDPLETFEFDYGLDLSGRPVAETLAAGEVVGTKGRVLVLRNAGTTYAVDMRSLVGYEVESGGSRRELQSSLGAFG
ncbi:DUF2797 domain-containing protein [Candidatus Halobonum tyrrellensis]|uniref:DUF2797 domain-containing protein n=1 Tax=Candidatus Halobonum tyrrellensis G22 TaxID=1324957 RepID=V4HJI4_9EURY|nr:DUF2797 domain-containing protein [Candidatus Halobonum tyrrellensis]ESP88079.1 hypothetical protein K933_11034 [Candidatus Halobonum tyrrellensis G22]